MESVSTVPASIRPVRQKHGKKNSAHHCIHSLGKFLSIPTLPAHNVKLVNKSLLCMAQAFFKVLPLCWVLERVSLCAGPLRTVSVSCSPPALPKWSPDAFQSFQSRALLIFKARHRDAHLSGTDPKGRGCPMCGSNPLLLRENYRCNMPPACQILCQGFGSWPDCISVPLIFLDVAFNLTVEEIFWWSSAYS